MDILGFIPINIASNSKYFLASRERYVGGMGGRRGPYRVLVGIPDRKWPLVRSRRRWDDNIKMYRRKVIMQLGFNWLCRKVSGEFL